MKAIKKAQTGAKATSTKKPQRGVAIDNTRVAKKFDVSKEMKQEKAAKRLKSDVKKVTRPYTVIAKPDPEAMFPGDSIRYYPGQRGGVGVPYIRDVAGSKGGLIGIDTKSSDEDFAKASRDKKNFRTYQDTLAVKANKDVMGKQKNGGKVAKKAKSGTTIAKAQGGSLIKKVIKSAEKAAPKKVIPKKIVKGLDIKSAIRTSSKELESLPKTKFESGGSVKAKDGKWIQKATASIKRRGTEGKCTPITKKGCTGKAKALAKTFKAMAKARKK